LREAEEGRGAGEAGAANFCWGADGNMNPEPYADFFDFIALGDGEELLPEVWC